MNTTHRIAINGSHRPRLAALLEAAQKRCTARTLDVSDVETILNNVDQRLDIPKCSLRGTLLYYSGAENFPSAYRYRPESTHFRAEHTGRCWVVTGASRHTCPDRYDNASLVLSPSAREALQRKHESFHVFSW